MAGLAVVGALVVMHTLSAQDRTATATSLLEFEVASIKRNTSDRPGPGPRPNPASGQYALTWITPRGIVFRAYPVRTAPALVEGLPSWADSEHYDVVVQAKLGATAEELEQMWKALLADRMKLAAHYETRPREAYNLVLARDDGKLGPQLKPSSLKCDPPDPSAPPEPPPAGLAEAYRQPNAALPPDVEAQLMSRCRGSFNVGNTTYAGALNIQGLILSMGLFTRMDRPVVDRTGLTGLYSIKLTAARVAVAPVTTAADNAPPSLFTALQEQLGLKLEPTTIEGQVLVIDHVERPTEN